MRPWQEIMNTFSKNQISDPYDNIDKTTKPPPEPPENEFCRFVDNVLSTQKLNFQESDEQELFEYLLESITTGRAYAKLWPNVKAYCRRTLPAPQWAQLERACQKATGKLPERKDQ